MSHGPRFSYRTRLLGHVALAITLAGVVTPVHAQVPGLGIDARACALLPAGERAAIRQQLFGIQWADPNRGDATVDLLFDESFWPGGGPKIGLASVGTDANPNWIFPPNWRRAQVCPNVTDVWLVAEGEIWLDSQDLCETQNFEGVNSQPIGVLSGDAPEVTTLADRHQVRWRPLIERDLTAQCANGGRLPRGFVVGYVAWSLPAEAWPAPTPTDFMLHGRKHLADLSSLDFGVPDPDGMGGSDLDTSDGLRLINPDGVPDTGDEILDLQVCPEGGLASWYAIQPVVKGNFAYFDGGEFSVLRHGSALVDLTGDGVADAADVLEDGRVELTDGCIGLGLTWLGAIATSRRPGRGEDLGGSPSCGSPADCDRGLRGSGIGDEGPSEPSALDLRPGTPVTIRRPTHSSLVVGWEETLGGGGYELYVGDLRVLARDHAYTHVAVLPCAPVPSSPVTIAMPPGDAYYLVTKIDDSGVESSYGRDSFGRERPASEWCP